MATLNLATPVRSEKVRSFQPPWRTVFIYKCPDCHEEVRVNANSFRGKTPVPGIGGIECPHCVENEDALAMAAQEYNDSVYDDADNAAAEAEKQAEQEAKNEEKKIAKRKKNR